jgi:hypothetical protein
VQRHRNGERRHGEAAIEMGEHVSPSAGAWMLRFSFLRHRKNAADTQKMRRVNNARNRVGERLQRDSRCLCAARRRKCIAASAALG